MICMEDFFTPSETAGSAFSFMASSKSSLDILWHSPRPRRSGARSRCCGTWPWWPCCACSEWGVSVPRKRERVSEWVLRASSKQKQNPVKTAWHKLTKVEMDEWTRVMVMSVSVSRWLVLPFPVPQNLQSGLDPLGFGVCHLEPFLVLPLTQNIKWKDVKMQLRFASTRDDNDDSAIFTKVQKHTYRHLAD